MGKYYCETCKISIEYNSKDIQRHNTSQKHKRIEESNKRYTRSKQKFERIAKSAIPETETNKLLTTETTPDYERMLGRKHLSKVDDSKLDRQKLLQEIKEEEDEEEGESNKSNFSSESATPSEKEFAKLKLNERLNQTNTREDIDKLKKYETVKEENSFFNLNKCLAVEGPEDCYEDEESHINELKNKLLCNEYASEIMEIQNDANTEDRKGFNDNVFKKRKMNKK